MSMMFQYMPNQETVHYTDAVATWEVIGINASTRAVTGYGSIALMEAAGDVLYPGLDAGMFAQSVILKCENGAGADGSAFYFATNRATAPADNDAQLVSGSGQGFAIPGPVTALWIRKTTAADEVMLSAYY